MKNKIIKFVFLVSLFFSIQGFANPINKIDFIGLNVISSSSLIDLLPVEIGDQYNEQTSNKIIEALFKTGYFSDIKVDLNNNNLLITLIENPVVKYFDVKTGSGSVWSDWLNFEIKCLALPCYGAVSLREVLEMSSPFCHTSVYLSPLE